MNEFTKKLKEEQSIELKRIEDWSFTEFEEVLFDKIIIYEESER